MGIYALTGGASGIGAQLRSQLQADGHTVISVDLKEGDVLADLSTPEGRQAAIDGIRDLAPGGLDAYIPCAGLSPVARPLSLIARVNYFAVVATVTGLRDLLAMKNGCVLIVASNSAPMVPADDPYVQKCLSGDEEVACAEVETRDGHTAYAGSKRAITMWMRRNVVEFAAQGVRMNAIAPGITITPMTEQVLADSELGDSIRQFSKSVPVGRDARPEDIANVACFMLSEQASFLAGSVYFVDGGSDAMLRSDEF